MELKPKGPCFGVRHLQALLLFLIKAVVSIGQTHAPVTIVAMTNADKSNPDFPEYAWSEEQRSYILSSLFVGELVTQLPGAFFIRRYGVKACLCVITFGAGLCNVLVPLCVPWGGWQIFCLLRFLQGVFQGCAYPAVMQHIANWSPPVERNRFSGFVSTGLKCGLVAAIFLGGLISASSMGWPGVFYASGSLSFVACILWLIGSANNAHASKFISAEERAYIEDSLRESLQFERKHLPVPWRAILSSKPFWALLVVRTAEQFSYFEIQTQLPAYMNGILQLNIKANAFYSALPYLTAFLMTFVFMFLADLIAKRAWLTLTNSRKCFNSLAMWLPAAGMIWMGFLDVEQKSLAIAVNTVFMTSSSASLYGYVMCFIELAPNHTEVIVVVISLFSCVALIVGPLFAGVIVTDVTNRMQWQILFAVIAVVYCIGDLVFIIWGSCKQQRWNDADYLVKKAEAQSVESKATIEETARELRLSKSN